MRPPVESVTPGRLPTVAAACAWVPPGPRYKRHGAQIEVKSTAGGGTTFTSTFTIPAPPDSGVAAPAPAENARRLVAKSARASALA